MRTCVTSPRVITSCQFKPEPPVIFKTQTCLSQGSTSRRRILHSTGVGILTSLSFLNPAEAGLDRYVKQRALDPLQNYVLPLLAAKSELRRAGVIADQDVDSARSLLREGALSALRSNARAVGEYAERLGTSEEGPTLVINVNKSIERFDTYLLLSSRNQESEDDPKDLLNQSISAIDNLLETVPQDVMDDVMGKEAPRPLEAS